MSGFTNALRVWWNQALDTLTGECLAYSLLEDGDARVISEYITEYLGAKDFIEGQRVRMVSKTLPDKVYMVIDIADGKPILKRIE